MPLRCHNVKIVLCSVEDVERPAAERRLFRFLTIGERFRLHGYPALYSTFCSHTSAARWTGNAYALPQLASCFLPVLEAVAASKAIKRDGLHALSKEEMAQLGRPQPLAALPDEEVRTPPKRQRRKTLRPSMSEDKEARSHGE